ncbi:MULTISPECIES: DUF2637 domain-containing protein [Streptomyces]|uniref:DUF2637 domain-containing protein n=1 Tax=Streptomyces TaxID=1883 RepID=UPI000B9E59C3|nr:DUF2637 domain-containing protein [Streptomyces kasugaensis]
MSISAAVPVPVPGVDRALTGVKAASTPVEIKQVITALAGALTVVLTAVAFWLSYEHLQGVASRHGMADAPARSWAWPATVDLFIVIGELLILRASLVKRVDWWAVGLATAGSGGSIALNVAGVGGNGQALDYVVAAVPPVAALLAFGALMRQVHAYLAARASTPVEAAPTGVALTVDQPPPPADTHPPLTITAVPELPPQTAGAPAEPVPVEAAPTPVDAQDGPVETASTGVDLCTPVIYPNRVDQLIRALYGTDFTQPNTARMTEAMASVGLGSSESTARTARSRVRTREPHLAAFPTAIAAA